MKRRTIVLIAVAVLVPLSLALIVGVALQDRTPAAPTPVGTLVATLGTTPRPTGEPTPAATQQTTPEAPPELPFDPLQVARTARNHFWPGPTGLYSDNGLRRVELDAWGMTFVPFIQGLPSAEQRLGFRLLEVQVGTESLYAAAAAGGLQPEQVDDDVAVFRHTPAFEERYDALDLALEQRFIFSEPLPRAGELLLTGQISTSLDAEMSPAGIARFSLEGTLELAYGEALARDAAGRELPLTMLLQRGQVLLTVPEDWLNRAAYPLEIRTTLWTQLHLVASGQQDAPLLISSDVNDDRRYLLVWADRSEGHWAVYGQFVRADGSLQGERFRIDDQADSNQRSPAVAYDPVEKRYMVAWEDDRHGGTAIYGRVINTDGSFFSDALRFSAEHATADQLAPAAAANTRPDRHRFLVTWTDTYTDTVGDVWGRLFLSDRSLGEPIEIAAVEGQAERAAAVGFDPVGGRWLVLWEEAGSGLDIAGRWVSLDGRQLDEGKMPVCAAPGDQRAPALAYNADKGQFLVVWEDRRAEDGDVYGQRLDGAGTLGGNAVIYNGAGEQRYPAVAYNADTNSFLASWLEGHCAIRARQVSYAGELTAGLYTLAIGQYERGRPALAYNPRNANQFLVVWSQPNPLKDTPDIIHGQWLQTHGLVEDRDGDDARPAAAYNADRDEYLVVWQRGGDIYGQRVAPTGAWSGDEIVICDMPGQQSWPAVAYDAANKHYLVVWEDDRDGRGNIHARAVAADGSLPGAILTLHEGAGVGKWPALAFDASSRQFLVAWQAGVQVDGCLVDLAMEPAVGICFSDLAEEEGEASSPAVAANPNASDAAYRFLVVWQHQRQEGGRGLFEVHGRFVGSAGGKTGAALGLLHGADYRYRPAVTYHPSADKYLVVAPRHDVFDQHTLAGTLVSSRGVAGESIGITGGQNYVEAHGLAGLSVHKERFWVSWLPQFGKSVYAIPVQAADGAVGRQVTVLGPDPDWELGTSLACDGRSRCLVVYGVSGGRLYGEFLFSR